MMDMLRDNLLFFLCCIMHVCLHPLPFRTGLVVQNLINSPSVRLCLSGSKMSARIVPLPPVAHHLQLSFIAAGRPSRMALHRRH
jgi:hypothetical protein